MAHGLRWTPTADAHLSAAWVEGAPLADIASDLGRTVAAVCRRASHLELPRRKRGPAPKGAAKRERYNATMAPDVLWQVRALAGEGGVSAWLEEAAKQRIARTGRVMVSPSEGS